MSRRSFDAQYARDLEKEPSFVRRRVPLNENGAVRQFISGDQYAVFCLGWARLGHYMRVRTEGTAA